MSSYVVRIYRARRHPTPALSGVVVEVEEGNRHPFRTAQELWSILAGLEVFQREGSEPGTGHGPALRRRRNPS
ncbi:MAG: hypothetical protein D6739_12405 [Nitrospirae bacterium]|nr:MAG: hypothetical protein D6739_12405 [Nitrospirota bacterium]